MLLHCSSIAKKQDEGQDMGRTAKTYRLPAETLEQIEQIAEREECSATRAVVLAVRAYSLQSSEGNAGAGAEQDGGNAELVQALRQQVETLTRALDQSQQLQLMALGKRLPAAGEKPKKKAKKKKRD